MKLWYNKNCSKSRGAKEILDENNIEYEIINYLDARITKEVLLELILKLKNGKPKELVRLEESGLTQLEVDNLTNEHIIDLLLFNKKAIQRPLIETENISFVARPIEIIFDYIKIDK